jgi:hypothetical protein
MVAAITGCSLYEGGRSHVGVPVTRVVGHYVRLSSGGAAARPGCGLGRRQPGDVEHWRRLSGLPPRRTGQAAPHRAEILVLGPSGSAARCVVPVSSLCRPPCVIVPYSLWTSSSTFQVHNLDSATSSMAQAQRSRRCAACRTLAQLRVEWLPSSVAVCLACRCTPSALVSRAAASSSRRAAPHTAIYTHVRVPALGRVRTAAGWLR